jgi:hypothetical protein
MQSCYKQPWRPTAVHGTQHAGDETVDTPAFLHERHKRGDPALVVGRVFEVCKDQLLERVDLVLQVHEIADSLIPVAIFIQRQKGVDHAYSPFIGVVDALESDVLLVFK